MFIPWVIYNQYYANVLYLQFIAEASNVSKNMRENCLKISQKFYYSCKWKWIGLHRLSSFVQNVQWTLIKFSLKMGASNFYCTCTNYLEKWIIRIYVCIKSNWIVYYTNPLTDKILKNLLILVYLSLLKMFQFVQEPKITFCIPSLCSHKIFI